MPGSPEVQVAVHGRWKLRNYQEGDLNFNVRNIYRNKDGSYRALIVVECTSLAPKGHVSVTYPLAAELSNPQLEWIESGTGFAALLGEGDVRVELMGGATEAEGTFSVFPIPYLYSVKHA